MRWAGLAGCCCGLAVLSWAGQHCAHLCGGSLSSEEGVTSRGALLMHEWLKSTALKVPSSLLAAHWTVLCSHLPQSI